MGNHNPTSIKNKMLTTDHEIENDLIQRYKQRVRMVWKEPNPYYVKGQFPTEYQELKIWIKKLEKLTKNS